MSFSLLSILFENVSHVKFIVLPSQQKPVGALER